MKRERVRLTLETAPSDVPAGVRLKRLLKTLGRYYGWKCVEIEEVRREAMDNSTCKSCGVPIVWITTGSGQAQPCDLALLTIVTEEGCTVRGHVPHGATCPTAAEQRRPKAQGRRPKQAKEPPA